MRWMLSFVVAGMMAVLPGGCNSYNLRYEARPQPRGANLFADYQLLQDAVGVSVDTDGRRLEDIFLKKTDGAIVRPMNIAYPAFGRVVSVGPGIGVGVGPVGIGTGIAYPVGPLRARGLTSATFSQTAAGPPPWEVHVKVHGAEEAVIPDVGGRATAK
jgi:hypothetical protein